MKFSAIFTSLIASASAQKPLKEWLFDPSVPSDVTIAQGTPDVTPPDWKAICDKISGDDDVANGLCVDYCVKKECYKGTKSPKVAQTCTKLNGDYKTLTGADIPCGKCPCIGGLQGWADALLSVNEASSFYQQIKNDDKYLNQQGSNGYAEITEYYARYAQFDYVSAIALNTYNPGCYLNYDGLFTTDAEADACIYVITAAAKTLGFTTLN
jgi:hypothetical protein